MASAQGTMQRIHIVTMTTHLLGCIPDVLVPNCLHCSVETRRLSTRFSYKFFERFQWPLNNLEWFHMKLWRNSHLVLYVSIKSYLVISWYHDVILKVSKGIMVVCWWLCRTLLSLVKQGPVSLTSTIKGEVSLRQHSLHSLQPSMSIDVCVLL